MGRHRPGAVRSRIAACVLGVAVALVPAACDGQATDDVAPPPPAVVEHLDSSDVARITLSRRAAERIGIVTATVRSGGGRTMVPSAAILVDPSGTSWVYTSRQDLVFIRHPVEVHHEEAGRAFLVEGPLPGTRVVTVGVAELYGAEFEIGH
jgi:hypothetical protein